MPTHNAVALAQHQVASFGSHGHSKMPLVKLVFRQSDKQLKSIQKQLCASAKGLANQLSKITAMVDEVHDILDDAASTKDHESDAAELLQDWKGIKKSYAAYLKEIRTLAVCGPTTISDFLCEFTEYMCSANDDIEVKREEAQIYSRHLLAESKQTNDGMRNFISLAQEVRKFRALWSASPSYTAVVDAKCASIFEKLESITNVRPSNDLALMLDNVSFPGVESASMTLLPTPWATQLYKLLEGDRTSKVESLRDRTNDARCVNVLGIFLSVCSMLSKDLNAVDNAIQCHAGNGQSGVLKSKLGIVYASYSSLSDALKEFAYVLSGVSTKDLKAHDRRPLARFKRWCILLLKLQD